MSTTRRQWNDSANPLLPWETDPTAQRPFTRDSETKSEPDKVVLYDHKGKPLVKARPRFGFRPEDAR